MRVPGTAAAALWIGALASLAACDPPLSPAAVEPLDSRAALLAQRPTCSGVPATLWAGMTPELIPTGAEIHLRQQATGYGISGTEGRDVIVGADGPDRIRGRGGNDLICASEGDFVWGGSGNDHLFAAGAATLRGGSGNDRLVGGLGRQRMYGGTGNDDLDGREDDDVMLGGPGNDVLRGGAGADFFGGCADSDVARDFDILDDWFNGTVEIGIPAGARLGEAPHDEDGCGGEEGDDGCDGGDHDDGEDHEGGCGG